MGSGGPRRLPPEMREKLLEILKAAVQGGYGYTRAWRMLRENGIEVLRGTIEYWYYKLFPEKVNIRGKRLLRELRIKLYEKVLELRGRGLGYKRIGRIIKEMHGVTLSLPTISGWCREIHSPFGEIRIPAIDFLKPSSELAYIIGVIAGGWAGL